MDGRTVWVQPGDVEGRIEAGNVVTATRELSDWCLRGDDGSDPVAAGTALEIVEDRAWGCFDGDGTAGPERGTGRGEHRGRRRRMDQGGAGA